jgi:hypothetical protein
MDDKQYDNKVSKHLEKWIATNRIQISLTIVAVIVAHLSLYIFWSFTGGEGYANQQLLQWLPEVLLVDLVGGIASFVYIAWYKIPKEIHDEAEKENLPRPGKANSGSEFYVPAPDEIKHRINIEAQKLRKQFKSMIYSSGKNRRSQYDDVMKTMTSIADNLSPHANRILKDTSIPSLLNEIHSQIISYGLNFSMLQEEYEEKNRWISVKQPIEKGLQERISELETTLDGIINSIETMIDRLIDLSQ